MTDVKQYSIIATADVHFERLEELMLPQLTEWIGAQIATYEPDLFIIAGDTVDSRNLRAETKEYRNLVTFLQQIDQVCVQHGTQFLILRGTPSHDGRVVENICKTIPQNIMYIDTLCVKTFRGKRILFIPELYYAKLDQFRDDLRKLLPEAADLAIFHGMMDFAIPQVIQIDSSFSQSRCIVMDHQELRKMVKVGCFGGHVHSHFGQHDVWYLGRFINERGHIPEEHTGLHLITIPQHEDTYQIQHLENPYVIPMERFELDFTNHSLEEILQQGSSRIGKLEETLFVCHTGSEESRKIFQQWKQLIQPIYLRQKKHKQEKTQVSYQVNHHEVSIKDLLQKMYEVRTGKTIPDYILELLEGEQNG